MKSLYKKTLCVLAVIALVFSLCACGEKGNKATVYFELLEEPYNLDPQTASTDSELIIVRNLFEGLMRVGEDGALKEGACNSYKASGKRYTFYLRENLKWSDGSKVTAEDFVFGLRRAVKKETEAPFVSRLFAIKNAQKINNGQADVSSLGVYADKDKVIINLEYEDENFLPALATSVAMPCKESFFKKTEGKYCQDASSIICNGSYDIYKWNKEEFGIRLYRNEEYSGAYPALNGAVFFSLDKKLTQTERLSDDASDIAFLPTLEVKTAQKEGISVKSVENICWFLTIGDMYDGTVKTALMSAFSSSVYKKDLGVLRAADSIYPEILNAPKSSGEGITPYNLDYAISLFNSVVKNSEEEKFPSAALYCYGKEEIKAVATDILGHWQQNLSAFVNLQTSDSLDSLQKELKTKQLQFALFPVTAYTSSKKEYLSFLGLSGDTDAASAQINLLANKNIVPVCFENTNIGYNGSLSGVYMDTGNGYIDFAYILKDE